MRLIRWQPVIAMPAAGACEQFVESADIKFCMSQLCMRGSSTGESPLGARIFLTPTFDADESDSSSDSEHGSPRHKAPTNILEGYKRGYDMEEDMEQDLAAEGLRTDADTSDDDAVSLLASLL